MHFQLLVNNNLSFPQVCATGIDASHFFLLSDLCGSFSPWQGQALNIRIALKKREFFPNFWNHQDCM